MFDWSGFIVVAEDLVARVGLADVTDEALFRSGTSRAYYAAFHVASTYVESLEGIRLPVQEAHGHLLKHFERIKDRDRRNEDKQIYENLKRLREARRQADYDSMAVFTRKGAEQSVKDAKTVIACVGHLRQKRGMP